MAIKIVCDECGKQIKTNDEVSLQIDTVELEATDGLYPDGLFESLHYHRACFAKLYPNIK